MSEKRRGLGRGLGALIPSSASAGASGNGVPTSRPVDLFFPEARKAAQTVDTPEVPETEVAKSSPSRGSSSKSTTAAKTPAAKSPAAKVASRESPAASEPAGTTADDAFSGSLPAEAPEVQLVEVPGARFAEIPVGDIHPNRKQPRSVFDEDDMAELVHSVKEIGVLQPIVVRTSTEKGGEPYELVMGERRWRAVQAAGLETIPAIVRDTNDDDLLRDALLENLHRSQLNPLEEAAAYQQLLEDFGTTHEQLADRIGRSRPQVSNTLRLLKLPPLVQRRVAASVLSAGHARALLALPDAAAMERLAQKIVSEGMSVRATEEAVALYQDPTVPPKNSIPRPNARHERLDYLASSLSDRLDTNVKITLGARKGRVSIEFASVEDLNRIMDVLSPGDEG
ncbi:ParB/RepB/Spo0J family partition protein [Arthrobacter sp. FW306-2-2C-D06B]|uniref:ParB/RepB/Spo0J family partition protein n=1 Tax=Arthrobacter sp. FW306-2-2C-D06B TaxID=2879618 RepID=UPI001EFFB41F|nr:ParB/RepB/Spo0J family partition protein [Arthrobacter sp. FW306-2-2C-D06B]UKA58779.1 ParB/RepB/Spo0J family partition protein [Arthrobacter sp. FW306-2-2C-D06B]